MNWAWTTEPRCRSATSATRRIVPRLASWPEFTPHATVRPGTPHPGAINSYGLIHSSHMSGSYPVSFAPAFGLLLA
jgi:hypothetical protein